MAIDFEDQKTKRLRELLLKSGTQKVSTPASTLIEFIASHSSSSVYLYDLASDLGFGGLIRSMEKNGGAQIIDMETRQGAGLALAGRLAGQSSEDHSPAGYITAFTSASGLAMMVHSLQYLPNPEVSHNRLVLQVSNVSVLNSTMEFTPSLASLSILWPVIPQHTTVVLSATSQEAVDMAKLSYNVHDKHVVHIFDQYSSAKEDVTVAWSNLQLMVKGRLTFDKALNDLGYSAFSYHGPADPKSVLVMLNTPLANYAKVLADNNGSFGVLLIRVLKPWNGEALKKAIPASVTQCFVLEDSLETGFGASYLYGEVFNTLFDPESDLEFHSKHISPEQLKLFTNSPTSLSIWLSSIGASSLDANLKVDIGNSKRLLFYSTGSAGLATLPSFVAKTFATSHAVKAHHSTEYDLFSKPGGTALDRIVIFPSDSSVVASTTVRAKHEVGLEFLIPASEDSEMTDFIAISDQTLLKTHSLLHTTKPSSPVLICTSWTAEELSSNLPSVVRDVIEAKKLRLYLFNAKELANEIGEGEALESCLGYAAFMRLYFGEGASKKLIAALAERSFGKLVPSSQLSIVVEKMWSGLEEVAIEPLKTQDEEESSTMKYFEFNSIVSPHSYDFTENQSNATLGSWRDAAKHLLFREAYSAAPDNVENNATSSNDNLRPDLLEERFLITCTVNRRLTPLTYDRNVFHVEFDTSGTGLKYAIGEALGVHGWNDSNDVLDFCKWYGINPDHIITLPVPESGGKQMHSRTVFQTLQQQIDIFGRPPKSFYGQLAEYATTREDRMALLFIAAPEGASTFKKMAEKDTVTFADVLQRFASARPGIEILAEIVGDIKPRHYSIASAMSAVGNRVDLLVVTVDWVTPSGSPRYGQCTRYLADMKIGQKVTVSIKPSVMKLPPDDMQPIIMAGLGTGAAPFRAFMQHRALLASQNKPAGPLLYYFGSRHRSEEYLYGEEIEAYISSSVITHAGLAFSRDTKRKIYIQHKMKDDAEMLVKMLLRDKGVFYLCGPTWPVPDVYETLVGALVQHQGQSDEDAGAYLEGLKEEERYVLEVY